MALLGIIRRWHLRDHVSLREISKRLGISRNTVRRYLRAETVEPAYADRRSPTSVDKYSFKLSARLKTEATKEFETDAHRLVCIGIGRVVRPGRSLRQTVEDGSVREVNSASNQHDVDFWTRHIRSRDTKSILQEAMGFELDHLLRPGNNNANASEKVILLSVMILADNIILEEKHAALRRRPC